MKDFLRALYLEHAEYFDQFQSQETVKAMEESFRKSQEYQSLFEGEPLKSVLEELLRAEFEEGMSRCADCFQTGFRLGVRLMLDCLT